MQRRINELKSINNARAYFDAAMKYPMNLVEERFKRLNMDDMPVEVILYSGDNTLKVFADTLIEFDPAFDTNIRSKYQIRKCHKLWNYLQARNISG